MLKTVLTVSLSLVSAGAFAQVSFEAQDVGEIYQTNTGHSAIIFNNTGDKPVKILSTAPMSDTDSVGAFKFPTTIAPRTSVNFPVTVFSGMDAGDRNHLFRIEFDDGKRATGGVKVHLFGLSVLDTPQPKVDLGTVNTNAVPPAKTVKLSSRAAP